ncbi:hypothetical protein BDP27DRAFT_1483240, partial [Rhodocollybia butyracea]
PQGIPDLICAKPHLYNTEDFTVKVPPELFDEMEAKYAPPDDPSLQLTPPEFQDIADNIYQQLGSPIVTLDNLWSVYTDMLAGLKQLWETEVESFQTVMNTADAAFDSNMPLIPNLKELREGLEIMPGGPHYMGGLNAGKGPDVLEQEEDDEEDLREYAEWTELQSIPGHQLEAEYTEAAPTDLICEHPSCKKVAPSLEYIGGLNETVPPTIPAPILHPGFDESEDIRKENARAQRGEPGKEIRIGTLSLYAPAPIPVNNAPPQYVIDGAGNQFFNSCSTCISGTVRIHLCGYSATSCWPSRSITIASITYFCPASIFESSYTQWTRMASMAYATDIEKKGIIEVWIVKFPESKRNWKTVGAIMVVKSGVPVNIGAHALKTFAFSVVLPLWNEWSHGYPLSINDLSLKDKNFEEISPPLNSPDVDCIQTHFFIPPKKANAPPTLKKDKVLVLLHILNKLLGQVEFEKINGSAENEPMTQPMTPPKLITPSLGMQRAHEPSTTPPSIKHKKSRTEPESSELIYHSPDRKRLAMALREEKIPVIKNIPIFCNSSMNLALKKSSSRRIDLVGLLRQPPVFDGPEIAIKQLFFTKMVFKSKPHEDPSGSKDRETKVEKAIYPYDPKVQHPALVMELKLTLWGWALLNLVYAYIKSVNPEEDISRFIEVPQFRFTQVALAVEMLPSLEPGARPKVFLLEENLETMKQGQFRKYMSNMPHIFLIFDDKENAAQY